MKNGFTLVELLVAVGIIGLLASISMVSFNGIRGKARDAKRISDIKEVQNALEIYYSSTGYYPSAIATAAAGLGTANVAMLCDTALGFDTEANCNGKTVYMSRVNENPTPNGTAYKYTPAAAGCDNAATTCQSYKMTFELMSQTGGYDAGCYTAAPEGMSRAGNNGDDACK